MCIRTCVAVVCIYVLYYMWSSSVGIPRHRNGTETEKGHMADVTAGDSQLSALIDSATTSPSLSLDVAVISSIKKIVRSSDANIRLAFDCLFNKLKYPHSQVRYLALLIVDELFARSKLFRQLLVEEFETFMILTVGYKSENPLPPPANRATTLKAKSMEIIEEWCEKFGAHYKPIRLGHEYLKNTLHLQFPNLRKAAAQAEQKQKEIVARSRALVLEKYQKLKDTFPVLSEDIQDTLKQLNECFEILYGSFKEGDSPEMMGSERIKVETDSSDDEEEYDVNSLRKILEEASSKPSTVCETQESSSLFHTVRDLIRIIDSQHIPAVQNWMSILMRVDTQDSESHGLLLRAIIDQRNQLVSAKGKCKDLGINLDQTTTKNSSQNNTNNEDDGIVWEEGLVYGESCNQTVEKKCVPINEAGQLPAIETRDTKSDVNNRPSIIAESCSQTAEKQGIIINRGDHLAVEGIVLEPRATKSGDFGDPNTVREKLLSEAPLLPWGSYLDRWGAEHTVPVNQRGLLLESHWGKVDFDALLPADKVSEMNMQVSYYEPTNSEIPPCLAPLRNGGLCQRRDLRTCPLHGPLIPRDSNGNPIPITLKEENIKPEFSNSKTSTSNNANADERDFMKDVGAQAVANVRAQDAAEMRRKMERKLQAKRNREHNAAVLRDAALARTRQGFGEVLKEDLETHGKRQKQGLKMGKSCLNAMLHPKPTLRERLDKRLSNSRFADATIRAIIKTEDVAFREASTNQW